MEEPTTENPNRSLTQDQIDTHLQGRFTKYKEYFLGPAAPLTPGVVLGEFDDGDVDGDVV